MSIISPLYDKFSLVNSHEKTNGLINVQKIERKKTVTQQPMNIGRFHKKILRLRLRLIVSHEQSSFCLNIFIYGGLGNKFYNLY